MQLEGWTSHQKRRPSWKNRVILRRIAPPLRRRAPPPPAGGEESATGASGARRSNKSCSSPAPPKASAARLRWSTTRWSYSNFREMRERLEALGATIGRSRLSGTPAAGQAAARLAPLRGHDTCLTASQRAL